MSLLDTSDKVFWHGYIDFYENFFLERDFINLAEIGIFKGNSIKWLLKRFPKAWIYGADILPPQPEWPTNERFKFTQMDQGDAHAVRNFFAQAKFDLIIEDGSHIPEHQALSLIEGVQALKSSGLYILEDIHTSHPFFNCKSAGPITVRKPFKGNALTVLLAIDHYKKIGVDIDSNKAESIAYNSILDPDHVKLIADSLADINLYRRTRLPDYCYRCGSSEYDFSSLRCKCGVEIFSNSDSMSFVLTKK